MRLPDLFAHGDSTMKRLASAFSLCLLITLFNTATNAQVNQADDSAAVRVTVRNYIEAYYTGDAQRMAQTLHPHYLKHMIHGDIPMREKTAEQMVQDVRTGPDDIPLAERTEQISVLDISGDIASAKLLTPHWVDYLTLTKLNGEWKILSVVQKMKD
jgi:hypothetical protein